MSPTICAPWLFAIACALGTNDPADLPNPVIREVIYKNAHHIPQKELDNLSGIRPGAPLDLAGNQAACVRIQDYLKNKGRYWATVSLEKGNVAGDDQVIFNITEGPIVRVRSTKFVGNEVQTTQCLQQMIAPLENSRGAFHAGSSMDNVKVLEGYYRSIGYRDVKVSRELKFSEDQSLVDIVYNIAEGLSFRVKDWVITSDSKELAPTIKELASTFLDHFKRGEFYNEAVAKSRLRDITDYFGWRGYPVEVTEQLSEIPGERGMLRVEYQVKELVQAKVGRIYVIGTDNVAQQPSSQPHGIGRSNLFEVKEDDKFAPPPEILPSFVPFQAPEVPSDFVISPVQIPGASADADLPERTNVKFVRPMNVHLCSVDPADLHRPTKVLRLGSRIGFCSHPEYEPIEAPGQYAFLQRRIHRLKLSAIDKDSFRSDVHVSMEVMAGDSRSREFLSRNAISVEFTDEDFKNIDEARTVIKIFYLSNPLDVDYADQGYGVRVSTHSGSTLDRVDPIHEARKRGSVLLVIRMGIGQIFSASVAPSPPSNHSPPTAPGIYHDAWGYKMIR